jgi:hypothetical protein
MKKLILIFAIALSNFINAQTLVFNFDGYLTFECPDKTVTGYDIVSSPKIEYVAVGFGKNHITIDFDEKTVTNEYYVREDYSGSLTYTGLSNYKESNGVTTFQATRTHPETKKSYTEYFVINKNALTAAENAPYLITYWYDGGIMLGNIINRDLIH